MAGRQFHWAVSGGPSREVTGAAQAPFTVAAVKSFLSPRLKRITLVRLTHVDCEMIIWRGGGGKRYFSFMLDLWKCKRSLPRRKAGRALSKYLNCTDQRACSLPAQGAFSRPFVRIHSDPSRDAAPMLE